MNTLSVQSFADGKLTLEKKGEDGKGKCPFDPFQRYASIMFGEYTTDKKLEERFYIKMFSFESLCLLSRLSRKQPVLGHFNELPGLWTRPDAQLSCLHTHRVQELLASW